MLEIKRISKTYRSKTGENVKALDEISLSFPDRGMVIILGKSGSGKSTLLNVIGGLDGFDEGELLIKGKSSKDFAGSDFDAYRNTFIGFIFQEYNILEDFTVGANIGLALELQGKKATSEAITEILRRVDMLGFADRKPNELSGGQKQRVAIARALVKDPEIIMADEPTGALDSNTGKAIFDTLKELSKEKLVIIVSHDRDFAEKYADRIVELSDGKIFSDVTRETVEGQEISTGIHRISDHLLRIKSGYTLTDDDVAMINEYLRTHGEDLLLSGDERINEGIKQSAGMIGSAEASVFKDTGDYRNETVYHPENTHFIRSRLPMKNALKMGASGFKHKTFRLVLTILLAVVSFTMFGLADTMAAFNKYRAAYDSLRGGNIDNASFSLGLKTVYTGDDGTETTYYTSAQMTQEDVETLCKETGLAFTPVYLPSQYYSATPFDLSSWMADTSKLSSKAYYQSQIGGVTSVSAIEASGLKLLAGRYPTADGEILLTKLVFDQLQMTGVIDKGTSKEIAPGKLVCSDDPSAENNIIGMQIPESIDLLSGYTVVGVIDTALDTSPYEELSVDSWDDGNLISYLLLRNELCDLLQYGYHELAFVTDDALTKIAKEGRVTSDFGTAMDYLMLTVSACEGSDNQEGLYYIAGSSYLDALDVHYFSSEHGEALGDNECLLSDFLIAELLGCGTDELTPERLEQCDDFVFRAEPYIYMETEEAYESTDVALGTEQLQVVGYYAGATKYNGYTIVSPSLLTAYNRWNAARANTDYTSKTVEHEDGFYPFAIAPMPSDAEEIRTLVSLNYRTGDDYHFSMENQVMTQLNSFSELIEELAEIFVWIGVGFAVFSALLLMNFISISISYKKREIGILRAVGARSSDVFKIFFSESMIIALINFLLAVAATIAAVIGINRAMMQEGIRITLLSFGIRQIGLMLLISVFVAAAASFLPVFRIARKKPVDAIKDR